MSFIQLEIAPNTANFIEENISLTFDNLDTLHINPKYVDVYKIKYLVLKFDEVYDIISEDDYKELIEETNLKITCGENVLTSIPLNLLCEINEPKITKNTLVIPIPEYFTCPILSCALQNVPTILTIVHYSETTRDYFTKIELYATCVFYNQDKKIKMIENPHIFPVQNIDTIGFVVPGNNMTVVFENSTYTKGYFINTNVDNIERISFHLDTVNRFEYDRTMIELFCNRISDNLLYVPFIYSQIPNFMKNTEESYEGSLYSKNFAIVTMSLNFNEISEKNVYVSSVNKCMVKIVNGSIEIIDPIDTSIGTDTSTGTNTGTGTDISTGTSTNHL